MFDVPQTNISKYFDEASDFIEEAVSSEGNKKTFSRNLKFLHLRQSIGSLSDGDVSECYPSPGLSGQEEKYECN